MTNFGWDNIVADPGHGEALVDRGSGRGRNGSWRSLVGVEPVQIRNHVIPRNRIVAVATEPWPIISKSIRVE